MTKGFTLIELLIVIAILAILTAAVVVVLNPAQLLAQARDSQRLSDLGSVQSAISLWLTTATSPSTSATSVVMIASSAATTLAGANRVFLNSANTGGATTTVNSSTNVSGTGWVPNNLTQATGGSPLGSLPSDPTNNASFFYAFCQTATSTFEVDAVLESTKYLSKETSDGGDNNAWYETGTNLAC